MNLKAFKKECQTSVVKRSGVTFAFAEHPKYDVCSLDLSFLVVETIRRLLLNIGFFILAKEDGNELRGIIKRMKKGVGCQEVMDTLKDFLASHEPMPHPFPLPQETSKRSQQAVKKILKIKLSMARHYQ